MELLKKLTQTYSPSGNEERIRKIIESEAKPYADDITTDALGNLIVHKKGDGAKMMLCAHMDEIGVLVTYIEDSGFLRFAPVGGVPTYCSLFQTVEFENGVRGVIGYEEKINITTELNLGKMYIDIGATSADEARKMVEIGDSAVFCGDFFTNGDNAVSKAMDNRAGVYVLLNVLKNMKESENDLYFVFSTQEELGLRGARAAANAILPDVALAVDVTDTGDTPNCNQMAVKLGGGPCIKFMDNSIITHKRVNDALKNSAKRTDTPYQCEVLILGGTDAGAIHTAGSGAMTGAVSIPTRYIHTPHECVNINDVKAAITLICDFAENKFDKGENNV